MVWQFILALMSSMKVLWEVWQYVEEKRKEGEEIEYREYLQKSHLVHGRLRSVKTQEDAIKAAIEVQSLVHRGGK